MSKKIDLGIVGDHSVGKTCLLFEYATDEFNQEYHPTDFDQFESTIEILPDHSSHLDEPLKYSINFCDIGGYTEDAMLKYWISKCECFIVAFNILNNQTFENAINKWIPLVKKCKPDAKLIESK